LVLKPRTGVESHERKGEQGVGCGVWGSHGGDVCFTTLKLNEKARNGLIRNVILLYVYVYAMRCNCIIFFIISRSLHVSGIHRAHHQEYNTASAVIGKHMSVGS
jgi:hypothetical protein